MDITKLTGYTPGQMAKIILGDHRTIRTEWGLKFEDGLAEMIAQAPDPDMELHELRELAKLGLELAEICENLDRIRGPLNRATKTLISTKARALINAAKGN